MATRIQLRRGIASSWTSSNPILASGEVGVETDTNKIKIGDGSSNWTELDYFADVYAASASIIAYINSEIGDLIDSAPALLDTLNELAAAIGDDASFFSSIRTTINSASATAYSSASAYTNAASASLVSYTNSQINALSTTDIEEGSRLYFTNQRAIDATSSLITSASANALSQANSYSNSASAAAYASASANTLSQINALTTTDIEEGTNKYFTNQRAIDAASATYILQTSQQSIINTASAAAVTAVLDGAPGALDTLNELAAALGDNPDILSTFITSNTASSIYLTQAAYASASPNFATDAELANKLDTSIYASASANFATDAELANKLDTSIYASASANFATDAELASAIVTASAAAVTAVLDGAPGALDTLNELAAALNDDSSFATTVTNSLAAKLDASSASATYLTQSNASASYVAQNSTGNEYIQDQASNLFIHSNHTNVTATYDDANNQVILVGSAGGGSAVGGGASILVSASAPVGAVEGDAWFDNTDGSFYVYDGTFWVETAPEGSGSTDGGSFTRWSKTYSGSATLISGTDDDLFSLNYYPGLEQVFINGILQDISNYTATSGSTIVLNEAVVNNDVVEVIAVQSFNFADAYTKAEIDQKVSNYTRWTKTMGASATTISGLDDSSLTLSYTVGNEEIFVNGILLTKTTDYTATSGSTVLLVEAVSSGDIVEIKSHETLNVTNLYTQTQADNKFLTQTSASSTYLTQSSASTTYAPVAAGGLVQIVPTSIAATGGSGSTSLTGAVSFTSASAISLNSCFTSVYDNYLIMFVGDGSTTAANLQFRMRVSGTDNSTSNSYISQSVQGNSTTVAGVRETTNYGVLGQVGSGNPNALEMKLFRPFLTEKTAILAQLQQAEDVSRVRNMSGVHTQATSYDGITLFPGTGTFTGTIRVYGYRNS